MTISLVMPVIAYVPPPPPPPPPDIGPEIAVKICGSWMSTLPPDWVYGVNFTLPPYYEDWGWFLPYHIEPPGTCTTFCVEIWFLNVEDLFAYEFSLVWNYAWLELESWEVHDLGPGGLTANADIGYFDPAETMPFYLQIWTFLDGGLGNATDPAGFTGSIQVATLTFHVLQDPVYPDAFYSLFMIAGVTASTSCGEPIEDIMVENAVAKLDSREPVIKKELSSNVTWIVGDEITVDINIYNVTKLKSFEFILNYPDWLEIDLQKNPIEIGDFLPPPYEELIIVVGPSANFPEICDTQVWVKVIRDCNKPPVSGDGTLASITFTVMNPYWELYDALGPCYEYDEELHLYLPETITDHICFKCPCGCEGPYMLLDGIKLVWAEHDVYDGEQDKYGTLLSPPFGFPFWHESWNYYFIVPDEHITFAPIPGDGNLDGHVGLLDMVLGTPFYHVTFTGSIWVDMFGTPIDIDEAAAELGLTTWEWICTFFLVDITGDWTVDLFDLVQMAKNWCTTEPFYIL